MESSSIGIPFHEWRVQFFEGAVFPHFVVAKSKRSDSDIENANRWSLLFTPGIRVRMLHERSNPVHTPSYMPRLDFQRLWIAQDRGSTVDVVGIHVAVEHHSNGQKGCLFTDQQLLNGKCDPVDFPDPERRRINTEDGSFSTNHIRGGVDFRRSDVDAQGLAKRDWTIGAEYQREFYSDPELTPVYTQNRVMGKASVAWSHLPLANRLRVEAVMGIAIDQPLKNISRWTFAPKAAWSPWEHSSMAFFVRLYHGQDYYNLHFNESIPRRVQIGVEFEQDGFLKFKPR